MTNKIRKYHKKQNYEQQGELLRDISIPIDKVYITINGMENNWIFTDYINDYIDILCTTKPLSYCNLGSESYLFSIMFYD